MMIAILIILIAILVVMFLTMLMIAAIVSKNKEKTLDETQADLFKAWGDSVINDYKK